MMKGMSKAAEKQSMGTHKHPVRPVPSPRLELQTFLGVRNRIETSPESGEKGPRGEGPAAKAGKTGQVGLSSTRTLERKTGQVGLSNTHILEKKTDQVGLSSTHTLERKSGQLGLSCARTLDHKQLEDRHSILFISVAWFTAGAQNTCKTLNLISTFFLPHAHPFSPLYPLISSPTTTPLCSVEKHRLWYLTDSDSSPNSALSSWVALSRLPPLHNPLFFSVNRLILPP